jgi:cyclin-dependent kinase-like
MKSRYEILGMVGEGAYGIVYKCKDKKNGEFVALKKFKEEEDEIVKKTMSRELKVLQILKHENIVEFKEFFKMKGHLYLVFEYVDKNLLELLQEHPKGLDPGLIKKLIYQMCKSVKYLHDLNIVHRDVKPENLLVNEQNKLKLCDFGFARVIKNTKEKLTDYVATRWYRSPELLITTGYYGPEVDYWAIGCIMGELADGDPLFPGENEIDQLNVIQKIIGRFADFQYEMFYSNPHFKNAKLLEVNRPETLERRYLGKLSKHAISFMKGLLHPDPKQRLNGDTVFTHPYFENYKDPFPPANIGNQGVNTSQLNLSAPNVESQNKQQTENNNANIKSKASTAIEQPIISNTTNINIINYNVDPNSGRSGPPENIKLTKTTVNGKDKLKLLEKIGNEGLSNNMILTSYNFNQGLKDMASLYSNTSFDKNFKTFYKGDQYNYNIDLHFLKKAKDSLSDKNSIKPKASDIKLKLDVYKGADSPRPKKKSEPKAKISTNSIRYEENHFRNKFSNLKLTGKGFGIKDFQLPYIQTKGVKKK